MQTNNTITLPSDKLLDILLNTITTYNELNQTFGASKATLQSNQWLGKFFTSASFDKSYDYYICIGEIKKATYNLMIEHILCNSPKVDIVLQQFYNVKTQLYPYQINNLNWMINIESGIYTEEYEQISKKIIFKGGGLFDEVGMGKTIQIIALVNHKYSTYTNLIKNNKIYSKATLIIVPNHLCGQWLREFETHTVKPLTIIKLLTKAHYKKFTQFELSNADVVIVSSRFFINCDLEHFEQVCMMSIIQNIFNKYVNIFNIYWHRVVIDEFHEIETTNLFEKLHFIESDYRWVISGTPFKEKEIHSIQNIEDTSLSTVIDFLTFDANQINRFDICNKIHYSYVKNHFSRNTHDANVKVLKLPKINEQIVWLNFTDTERMIYNAYLADPNNTQDDVFLRQICCHPMISDKLRNMLPKSVNSLEDIKKHIQDMYMSEYLRAEENLQQCVNRIQRISGEMKEMEALGKTNLIGYKNLKDDLESANFKVFELKKIRDGKEKTVGYYKKFIELISSMDNVVGKDCPICLDNVKEGDLGITYCGHIYCYSCISTILKESKNAGIGTRCPTCRKDLDVDKIFLIGQTSNTDVNELGTKLAWIIDYIKKTPNKYRIIFSQWDYLLKEVGKVLDGKGIKNLYCQGNVYQKDRVLRLFNAEPTNDPNDPNSNYRVIMLSSESTVSGANLHNAEEVIFLDPVYGDKQHRINTEKQAIGRVIRLGNKHENINIIRLLIKDSVEEIIHKSNLEN